MVVFAHHLYEYKKGLRNLILHTTDAMFEEMIVCKLKNNGVSYIIEKLGDSKINVFFGNKTCIDALKFLNLRDLSRLSDEEDFILGIMLGYDRIKQVERYVKRKQNAFDLTQRQELAG
jgi:hypothetical protein